MAEKGFMRAVSCEFCNYPAQYQCQNCDDPLCSTCKEKHEKKKPHHKYVPYSQKESRLCSKHGGHNYIYWCKPCNKACCTECVVTSHSKHEMISIEGALRTKKEEVKMNLDGKWKEDMAIWRTLLQEARKIRHGFTKYIQKTDDDIVAHATRIHTAVDQNISKIRDELRKMQTSTETRLKSQEKDINDKYEKLQESINKLDDLQDGYNIRLLECTVEPADIENFPALTRCSTPTYTPGQIIDQTIKTMIGKLTTSIESLNKDQYKHTSCDMLRKLFISKDSPILTSSLPTPEAVSSFIAGYYDPHIACTTSSDLAWVKTGDICLQLMDRQGSVQDTINTDLYFNDVTVNISEDLLFTDVTNNRIVTASKGRTSWRFNVLFSVPYTPSGICCLCNGDVVVTYPYEHCVIQYNKVGDVIHEFDQSLFLWPVRVAVNAVNDDLYVSDRDKRKVLAFRADHTLRYQYAGSDNKSFSPWDVSTDTSGRVLMTDRENNRIDILDKNGKFLQYLQPTGLKEPWYIDTNSERKAWIGQYKGQVTIVKYHST